MSRMPQRLVAVMALLGVAACGSDTSVFGADDLDPRVESGKVFVIALDSSPSVGDDWRMTRTPDPAVVEAVSDEQIMEGDAIGGPGRHEFVFRAVASGETVIELFNCWRCGNSDKPAPENENESETLTFHVEVE